MGKKWTLLVVVLMLIVPMMLTACGGDDDKGSGSSDVKLTETFTGEMLGVTVKYPEGWAAAEGEDGSVMIGNSQAMLDKAMAGGEDNDPTGDEFGIVIFAVPLAMLGEGMDLDTSFGMMAAGMASEDENTTTSEVKTVKVGDNDARRMDISDETTEGLVVGFMNNDALVVVAGVAAKDKLGDNEATALKIAESIEVAEMAAE